MWDRPRTAAKVVADFVHVPGAEVVTVASRSPERAAAFADAHGIGGYHASYRSIVEDDGSTSCTSPPRTHSTAAPPRGRCACTAPTAGSTSRRVFTTPDTFVLHRTGHGSARGVAHDRQVQMRIDLVTIVVEEYDPAIAFFVDGLGFELVEDSPSLTNDGRPKCWVVVRPPGTQTGLLLARADGERQAGAVGNQVAGRVGFFLQVPDFDATFTRMTLAGVKFVSPPRSEAYGRVAVFLDVAGNRWDLFGPV